MAAGLILGQAVSVPLAVLASDSDVKLAGQVVLTNIQPVGGWTSEKRAETIQQNLDNALVATKDMGTPAVAVTYVKGTPVLTLGGYNVATVDSASAKAEGTTPALLAKKWADALRAAVRDTESLSAYVSQISGEYTASAPKVIASSSQTVSSNDFQAPQRPAMDVTSQRSPEYSAQASRSFQYQPPVQDQQMPNPGMSPGYPQYGQMPPMQGRVVFAPAGLVIPAILNTSITSEVARAGDMLQATISQPIILGDSQIPSGSVLIGQVTDADAGRMLGRSGGLEIKFTSLRTPDGQDVPMFAHLVGEVGKYKDGGNDKSDSFKGENWKGKVVQAGVRGLIGAGTGAALGTAVGAIAGGRRGVGRGAWSGTAIGGGVGVAQSLLLRKGANVNIQSGTPIKLQLDSPLQFAGTPSTNLSAPLATRIY